MMINVILEERGTGGAGFRFMYATFLREAAHVLGRTDLADMGNKMMQIGGLRPKNYDENFKNVFYTGASTIPGTGLPMVMISAKLAVDRILKYRD
jgi:phytoene dehydrogenase-like protein